MVRRADAGKPGPRAVIILDHLPWDGAAAPNAVPIAIALVVVLPSANSQPVVAA
jgi:hypothetical protein